MKEVACVFADTRAPEGWQEGKWGVNSLIKLTSSDDKSEIHKAATCTRLSDEEQWFYIYDSISTFWISSNSVHHVIMS